VKKRRKNLISGGVSNKISGGVENRRKHRIELGEV